MVEYKGGIVSQLNNCGVSYTPTGRYLWGAGRLTTDLQSNSKTISKLYNASNGILSVTSDGEAYFSPDGRYLTGGNSSTRYLGKYDEAQAYGNTIILQNRSTKRVKGRVVRMASTLKVYTNPGSASESVKTVTLVKDSALLKNSIGSAPDEWYYEVVGGANDEIFLREVILTQRPSKNPRLRVRSEYLSLVAVKDIADLSSESGSFRKLHVIQKTPRVRNRPAKVLNQPEMNLVGNIKKIIPYNEGLLTYTNDQIIVSSNTSNVVTGSGTNVLNTSGKTISSVLQRGGAGYERGLLVAYTDGTSYFSEDGQNLVGGGKTSQITSPFNTSDIRSELNAYLKNERHSTYSDGNTAVVDSIKVSILNKGESEEFSKNFIVGKSGTEGSSAVSAIAGQLDGDPATVKVYNKGWSNWQYKWRYQGKQTGLIEHSYDAQVIADLYYW